MLKLVRSFAVLSVIFGASSALAASLEQIEGTVLVNKSGGFLRVSGPTSVAPGTRVMARVASSAVIVYDNGCRERVEPGSVVTVKPEGVCREAAAVDPFLVAAGTVIVVGGGAAILAESRSDKPASP